MNDSILFVYSSGLFLEDNMNPGTYVPECSWYTPISSMADRKITEFIELCNKYGFNPEVKMKIDKIA
jgi:hypothetical protein